ncbi:hypothetical protein AM588_10002426 [Phytophthora nicotianae]|uniref:C2 domain-containing protein n=1 Tax=Phytophthora nicotianae TaxID=4792 RepID=A0A0W8D0F4_PHYNI|nr:hypothetical protein AM588_10002426 [Phytophthora nicotianae]
MQAPSAPALRLRLLDPSVGVVSGGTCVVLHGAGFRPPPHSLTVRLRVDLQDAEYDNHSDTSDQLTWTSRPSISNTVDINGRFLLDTQLECVIPSFERQAARVIAARMCLAASSASVSSAPQLVPLNVEVILNGGEQRSNTLSFKLHQPLEVRRICPQSVFMMSPAVTATVTLNILKLSIPAAHKLTPKGGQLEVLEGISTLPVFVRVKQTSERTGAVSEQTREGKWKISPLGVYVVEFDAPTMGFGAVSVELSLNRVEFFKCKSDAPPEGFGYRVLRDVTLRAMEPACISVTSGQATEIKLVGDGFVDTGDIVVAMVQKELSSQVEKEVQVAQLNATYYGKNEVRCTVPANLPFGCTSFSVSLNGGRQFGQSRVVGLLHRDRALEVVTPASSSLAGGTAVTIRHSCLTLEDVDAFHQLQRLDPPRRIRVRFQPVSYSGSESGGLAKVVNADALSQTPGVLICKTPNFMENIKALNGMRAAGASENDGDSVPYIWRFTVAIALGGDFFQGDLPFSFYLPPVIRSLTQHHGPSTGDTCVKLRMKHKVPPRLKLLIRFSTLDFTKSMTTEGHVVEPNTTTIQDSKIESIAPQQIADDPEYLISCTTPPWTENLAGTTREVPHLTILQVSYDAGVTFYPVIDPPPTVTQSNPLAKDLSYLCFLFYPPPIVRSATPLSADILGGSHVRLQGEHLVDHGAQMSVIFESSTMSRKVSAFVEKGELRCCAPPFNVGRARVFVSLNDEQYTLCDLHDPETNAPVEFIFYSSPTVTRISPLCACVRQSSELKIYGTNLIETDRIKVRVSFPASAGRRLVFKDVPGTAHNGVITATTPVFPDEYANQNALVDVALNGANLSGTSVPLRYFSKYGITRVDPPLGAFEVPVTLTVFLAPVIVTDKILVRLRLGFIKTTAEHEPSKQELEIMYGPVEASTWTASSVEVLIPALSSLVESLPVLTTVHVEVSFDDVHFHGVGDLRDHYRVYNIPQLTSATPLFGLSDRETRIMAHGVHMRPDGVVKLTLFLESTSADKKSKDRRVATRAALVPVTTVTADVNVKRQRLSFTCPSLSQLRASTDRQSAPFIAPSPGIINGVPDRRIQGDSVGGMLLPERVIMQISVIDGQPISLPFVFRYYRAPTLVSMNPHVGYVCSGSIISFEFAERIATPTVDFRFGDSLPTSGRIRDERFVECFSPELSAGTHSISISFNEQHYELAVLMEHKVESQEDNQLSVATFHAFPLPVFVLPPAGRDRVYAFGPTSGGTVVVIKGKGFVPDTKIYVRFASQFKDAFDGQSEIIVGAKVVDGETIRCISPPSMRLGRAVLHVSYNLQQFSDSTCYFEYHAPTRYVAKGTLCGPISGQTPLKLVVEDMKGLPSHTQLLQCAVRFESEKSHASVDVDAQFDQETCVLSCITPAWPSNELVSLRVSLSRGEGELFEDTRIKFLFYDPPEGVIKIEPAAGPIGGGTEVLAWCARNLRASKKNACNPFAVVYVGKLQLKSTRKDGVFSPVWNELFDFEWPSDSDSNLASVRVVFENQLTADQSESLGHVELKFPVKDKLTQAFALRAWLPLRRIRGKYYRKENEETAVKNLKTSKQAPAPSISTSNLGEVELAIAFVPPVTQAKKHKKALRSSIISVITTQPQSRKPSQAKGGLSTYSLKKEKLLRAFRQRGAPVSLVPTELAVELALNGQDFWSVAPSTCYSILTPIVVDVEPKFISIAGGSTLYVSGNNFVNTGCLRVAFAVVTKDDTTQTLGSERTIVVEAKYRSSTSIVCMTPPLKLATEASYVNVYISLNGSDFDGIALPKQLIKLSEPAAERPLTGVNVDERIEESDETEEPPRKSPRKNTENDSAITLVSEQYVVDCKRIISLALDGNGSGGFLSTRLATSRNENFLLVPQVRVYLTPKVTRVRPTDGIYTSHLTIDGTNFTNTGIATGKVLIECLTFSNIHLHGCFFSTLYVPVCRCRSPYSEACCGIQYTDGMLRS